MPRRSRWFGALDNGNNTIIGNDGSAIWATFGGFVRGSSPAARRERPATSR